MRTNRIGLAANDLGSILYMSEESTALRYDNLFILFDGN
ncbi:hypothetical protein vBSenI1_19 [Salmonella phage vB_Sen_I1]|uniref:Uncharacterized protein n=1 Tax=Salmonella phage vB_Sen_I1 TaxID=2723910 RepID=A0A7L5CH41_9CAUD|nr:hypothetical protein vBSenI1_19 [Salmonella phage vB_Sen_I1]